MKLFFFDDEFYNVHDVRRLQLDSYFRRRETNTLLRLVQTCLFYGVDVKLKETTKHKMLLTLFALAVSTS